MTSFHDNHKYILSVFLGLGLAFLFDRSCSDNNCLRFTTSHLSQADEKVHKCTTKCSHYAFLPTFFYANKTS